MGITGLLPLLKSIHKPCSLKKFAGQTIGVDAYGWLHRGTVSCTMDLVMGKPTRKFVDFAMHRVRMLQYFGIVPFIVFDGDYLPSKAATEADRLKRRAASKTLGLELLNAGKVSQANLELQKAVDVTPEMARQLIDELNKVGVQYIVAPYEADAQMVYLERKGVISGILSEDSDLLVFGAQCLLTKLDQYGNCIEINQADFCACREINLTGWTEKEFRQMAILSGCDYLASIANMGLKTAYRMIRKHKTIEKVIRMLQFDGKYHVPKDYLDAFYQAELTFLHQRVFCPIANEVVFHTEPEQPLDEEKVTFIGAHVDTEIARKVATGELNPMTKEPIVMNQRMIAPTPRKSWTAPKPQFQTAVSSQDLKKGVSIDNFFKPKRTPLAELDINCFSSSPSQQDALRRNSGPWLATPVPRPYLSRSTTGSEPQLPQPRSAPPRAQTGRSLSSNFASAPRPQKRARLCSDSTSDTPIEDLKLSRSRFFESASEPSPSIGQSIKNQKHKKDDVYIYSDDSIEEAMLSLPDFAGFKRDAKKVEVFAEDTVASNLTVPNLKCAASSTIETTTQNSRTSTLGGTSFVTVPSLTRSASLSSTVNYLSTPVTTVTTPAATSLKSQFGFTPKAQFSTLAQNNDFLTSPSSVKTSRIPVPARPQARQSASTPLESLGVKVLNRPKPAALMRTPPYTSLSTLAGTRNIASFIHPPKARPAGLGGLPFPEVGRSMMGKQSYLKIITEPVDIPLPDQDEKEKLALVSSPLKDNGHNRYGSEDLIVHDSEEEELRSPVERVNFGKFDFRA